jgi:hypothetical protein
MFMTELIFVRHGQGIHNTNIPERLNYINPRLTDLGKLQVSSLKDTFTLNNEDLFVVKFMDNKGYFYPLSNWFINILYEDEPGVTRFNQQFP